MSIESERQRRIRERKKRRQREALMRLICILIILLLVIVVALVILKKQNDSQQEAEVETEITTEQVTELETETESQPVLSEDTYVVVVDAGHGGKDQGCAYEQEIIEKDINLQFAEKLQESLEAEGVYVIMTRTDDTTTYLNRRVAAAEDGLADVYISIHADYYPDDTSIYGFTIHYEDGAPGGEKLANAVYTHLTEGNFTKIRNVQASDLYVCRRTTMPSILVETGFLSNPEDRAKLVDETYMEDVATYMTEGILDYLDTYGKTDQTVDDSPFTDEEMEGVE